MSEKIFFGKISASANKEFNAMQIETKRYYADKGSSWFGDIKPLNYCFILSGSDIYLWKATEYNSDEEGDFLQFEEVINGKLPISGNKFRALNIFKFNSDLMVLSIRQVRSKAFFELETTSNFKLENIKNVNYYEDNSNYRNIQIVDTNFDEFDETRIYIIKDNDKVSLYKSGFFDDNTFSKFRDNTKYIQGKKRNKNSTLLKILQSKINDIIDTDVLPLNSLYDSFFVDYDKDFIENDENIQISKSTQTKDKKHMQPLNQILYGPPGTGKTYNTINKSLEIIENITEEDLEKETRNQLNKRFKEYINSGLIVFLTFHQSYGYEEFVEGIKAKTENGNVKYTVEPGIFKKLCENTKDTNRSFKDNIEKYRTLLDKEEIVLNTRTGVPFRLTKSDYGIATQTNHSFSIEKLEQINNGIFTSNPDHTYGKFIVEDINKRFNANNENKKHILIIDEINRGNISKIFGELITLIEASKRIGAEEEIQLKLPYSKDTFGVPLNLYIIGTMNTADRSIAQIDTALRRRFIFQEMMPKPELLVDENGIPIVIEDTEIEVQKILESINERIEYIYDREHTIGHSYFMPLIDEPTKDKLDEIFRVTIIPLLAEYFYGDWGDIQTILNNDFIEEKRSKKYKIDDNRRENKVYKINDNFIEQEYINIYDGFNS